MSPRGVAAYPLLLLSLSALPSPSLCAPGLTGQFPLPPKFASSFISAGTKKQTACSQVVSLPILLHLGWGRMGELFVNQPSLLFFNLVFYSQSLLLSSLVSSKSHLEGRNMQVGLEKWRCGSSHSRSERIVKHHQSI